MTPLTLHQHCFNRNLAKVLKLFCIHPITLNSEILKCTLFSTCNSWVELSVGTACTLYLLPLICIFWHSTSHLSASLCDLLFPVTDYDPLNLHYLSIVSYFPTYVSGIFFSLWYKSLEDHSSNMYLVFPPSLSLDTFKDPLKRIKNFNYSLLGSCCILKEEKSYVLKNKI